MLAVGLLAGALATAMLGGVGIGIGAALGAASLGCLIYSVVQADSLREDKVKSKAQLAADAVIANLQQHSVGLSQEQQAAVAQAVYETTLIQWKKRLDDSRRAEAVGTGIVLTPM